MSRVKNQRWSTVLFFCLICLVYWQQTTAQTPLPSSKITPLSIGDKIPDALWNLPLRVVNHPQGKQTITLADYKEKLIILDFWATWCSSCIKSLNKLDSLQNPLGNSTVIIPITYENEQKILPFLKNRKLSLFSIVSETTLKLYFPHKFIPHQIWIKDNTVRGIVKGEDASILNIENILNNSSETLHTKRDMLDYKSSDDLLLLAEKAGTPTISFSVFTPVIEGIPSTIRTTEIDGKKIINFTNLPFPLLYSGALEARNNQIRFIGVNTIKTQNLNSHLRNSYCYQLIIPDTVNKRKIKEKILSDLNQQFNIKIDSQIVNTYCYVIEKASNAKTNFNNTDLKSTDLLTQDFASFVDLLNFSTKWSPDQPIFIDHSNYTGTITAEPYRVLQKDISKLKTTLERYGLVINKKKYPVKMYILDDKKL